MKTRIVLIIVVLLTWLAVVKGASDGTGAASNVRMSSCVFHVSVGPGSGLVDQSIQSHFRFQPAILEREPEEHAQWSKKSVEGLILYDRAIYTQSIATTNNAPRITPTHRGYLESKYRHPGGLDKIQNWTSTFYKSKEVRAYQQRIPVKNSFGYYQNELGFTRVYPVGMEFHDVLRNAETGEVFEHRRRKKEADGWVSEILFRNRKARPEGYKGVSVTKCAECHKDAGSGDYGEGMAPGADGVFSDPVPELER